MFLNKFIGTFKTIVRIALSRQLIPLTFPLAINPGSFIKYSFVKYFALSVEFGVQKLSNVITAFGIILFFV